MGLEGFHIAIWIKRGGNHLTVGPNKSSETIFGLVSYPIFCRICPVENTKANNI